MNITVLVDYLMGDFYSKDYSLKTQFHASNGLVSNLKFFNPEGLNEAPGDMPAEAIFARSGHLLHAFWRTNGILGRWEDLPFSVTYSALNNRLIGLGWHLDGYEHREGGKPSGIGLDEKTGEIRYLEYRTFGESGLMNDKPAHVYIDPADGQTLDESGYPIDFEVPEVTLPETVPLIAPIGMSCLFK